MYRNMHGFTLVELMISVAIVAILAAVALPSYQRYVVAARRPDAVNMLQRVAAAEEQYFFSHNKYTDNTGDELGLGKSGAIISSERYYSIAVEVLTDTTYTLTATPVQNGPQKNDAECATFTLDQTGKKGSSTGGIDTCWRR